MSCRKTNTVEKMPPWFHFGFLLPSAAEVETLYAQMRERGVRLRKLSRENKCVGFRCYDPDGYLLEFCYEPGRTDPRRE